MLMSEIEPRRVPSWRTTLHGVADLLLPPVCIVCRARVESHGLLCGDCLAKIDFIVPPLCTRLGVPCLTMPPVYDRARAVARYSETMRDLIQSFKYRDRQEGLSLFGRWLKHSGAELLSDADLIVPVPALSCAPVVAAVQPIGHAGARPVAADGGCLPTASC